MQRKSGSSFGKRNLDRKLQIKEKGSHNMSSHATKIWFGVIFLLAFFVRMSIFGIISQEPLKYYTDSDAYSYELIASNLLNHGVFAQEKNPSLTPDLYRKPVYPLILAGVYAGTNNSATVVIILQLISGSISAALSYLLSFQLDLPKSYSIISGVIVALDPLTIFTTYQLLTETFFTTRILLGLILLAIYWKTGNASHLILSSIIIGEAALIRPIGQYIPFILLPFFWLFYKKVNLPFNIILQHNVLFLLFGLLITQSWAYRNYHEAGLWTVSAIGDKNLLFYRARDVLSMAENISQSAADEELNQYMQTQITEII